MRGIKLKRRRKLLRRPLAAVLSAALVAAGITGCGEIGANDPDFAKGKPWIDSDLIGSISEGDEIRLQDDFAAAANKEWILTEGAEIKDRAFAHVMDIVNDKKLALLSDDSLTGKEAQELKKFAALSSDWDDREQNGVEPLRPYLESIDAISSIDEYYAWITDIDKNPLGIAPVSVGVVMARMSAFPDEVIVLYNAPELSLGDQGFYYHLLGQGLERKEITDGKVSYLLTRLGYTEAEIDRILKENYAIEKKIASIVMPDPTDEDAELKMTDPTDDLIAAAGSYPLAEYMESRGFYNVKHMIGDRRYLEKISGICKEGNLEGLKSMLTVGYVLNLGRYLDRDAYDTFVKMSYSRTVKEEPDERSDAEKERDRICSEITSSGLIAAMDKLYLEKYVDPETAEELTGLTKDIIDIYRTEIFPNEHWLSDEGKALALEKLDAIVLNVLYPDFSHADYDSLDIVAGEDGGSYLEAYLESMRFLSRMKGEKAGRKFERDEWFPFEPAFSTTTPNSVYMPQANSINIYAGILEDPVYHKGMSREELLGGIGTIIGHEITHGFDDSGVLYDKDGIKNKWMPLPDQQKFTERAANVSTYYSNLEPYKSSGPYLGSNVVGEAVADMGGLRACLALGQKEADFDYDKFFHRYANLWAGQVTLDTEQWLFKNDEHPLGIFRVNVGVQQFDEFYETYGVQPEDKMYLEEKKRIAVW